MASIIRKMKTEDADAVREVQVTAFGTWWRQWHSDSTGLPKRTRADVLMCLEKDPEGCFVAEEAAGVVGAIFSRTWDGVGWFGPFVVLPEYQGRGIGQQLLTASLEYLYRDPARVIGLETMPESPYNLGLYLRQGFEARFLTLLMSKSLEPSDAQDMNLSPWSSANDEMRARWLADFRQATGMIQPGLDYSKEIVVMVRHDLGETLVLTIDGRAIGMSTIRLTSPHESGSEELASIHLLALHPDHTTEDSLRALVVGSETLARARGKQKLAVWVNTCHARAVARLLGWGFRIERSMVQMVLRGTDQGPRSDDYVNIGRWAG